MARRLDYLKKIAELEILGLAESTRRKVRLPQTQNQWLEILGRVERYFPPTQSLVELQSCATKDVVYILLIYYVLYPLYPT